MLWGIRNAQGRDFTPKPLLRKKVLGCMCVCIYIYISIYIYIYITYYRRIYRSISARDYKEIRVASTNFSHTPILKRNSPAKRKKHLTTH